MSVSSTTGKTELLTADKLPKDVDFKYNCRVPSRHSRAFKEMVLTLLSDPERFGDLNSGIYIAGDRYILDGGHTWLAIQEAVKEGIDPKRIKVRVTRLGELAPREMAERSVGLNRKVTPPLRGEKAILGDWQPIEQVLAPKYRDLFEFKPGASPNASFKVDLIVALLHGWSTHSNERCYSSKGVLVRLFTADKYARLLPLVNVQLEFWSRIYRDVCEMMPVKKEVNGYQKDLATILPNGEPCEGRLSEAFVWPLFNAFHTQFPQNAVIPEEQEALRKCVIAWEKKKKKMFARLMLDFRGVGENPNALGKDNTVYLHQVVELLAD